MRRTTGTTGRTRPGRLRRRLTALLVVVLVLALAAVGGISWYFSGQALLVDHSRTYPHRVEAVGDGTVRLLRDHYSDLPGRYALVWDGGHAQVGEVTATTATTVDRRLTPGTGPGGGTPAVGTPTWVDANVFVGDPRTALGFDFEDVTVRSDVGDLPTWYVPGAPDATTWVVFVHGRGATREESLRALPVWHDLGFPVVVPTYRNDVGAPASPDGRYHLGDTEWRDATAAVRWALDQGARDVVLAGWSMGGAIAFQALDRGGIVERVRGLVLDSPVLDWRDVFAVQGGDRGLPRWLTACAVLVVERRIGADLDRFDRPALARTLTRPVLLYHSDADSYVPDGPSKALAKARPDLVTYVDTPGAEHTRSWNVDPDRYAERMREWFSANGITAGGRAAAVTAG